MQEFGLALFESTQVAMQAEAAAKAASLKIRIVPTPEKLFASCGFALRYQLEQEAALLPLLKDDLQPKGIYHAQRSGIKTTYTKTLHLRNEG